ncbi:Circadian clock-controlled protein [Eumeta japonica]|uniref:Circadian clock-controlled protein n=1 Tax=Eumeta variegata TaxID=151549 RepID=A0A4C1YRZ0_EUMVA|nr:Circadian clock-controlled protein [Eumeta japonica]
MLTVRHMKLCRPELPANDITHRINTLRSFLVLLRLLILRRYDAFVTNFTTAEFPPFLKPCSASDPQLDACVARAIQAAGPRFAEGLQEFGVAPLDPVRLGTVTVNNPALRLTFTDTVVTGLKGFRLNSVKMNPQKGKVTLDFVANVTLKAHYKMDGQVLILPIRGDGQAKIKITNLNIIIKYDYETENGHWRVPSYKDTYKMERAQFKFNNLFGGNNKELSNTVHMVMNTNWESVIKDIAPVAFEQIIMACVNEVKKFFSAVPAIDLLQP